MKSTTLLELETIDTETGAINAVIETPGGSRNKFKYDTKVHQLIFDKVLPVGAVFPYDFGFFPSTLGEDGDPTDVLVLMDEPAYPGIVVRVRLIGGLKAEQTANGKTIRNDRLIAVANKSLVYQDVHELSDLNESLISQIEHFFISYNQTEGREFKPIGRPDSKEAAQLLTEGQKRFAAKRSDST